MYQVMDRALKERIVGAIVLVVFAVLVVPVFLDGPSSEQDIISETVTLPGQNNQERKRQTIVLEQDRTAPMPGAATNTPAAKSPAPRQTAVAVDKKPNPAVQQKTAPEKAPEPITVARAEPSSLPAESARKETAAAREQSSTGMWAVQLGSFSSDENAERLAADLRKQGYAAFLSKLQTGTGAMQRVRVGPQKDRAAAEAVASQLSKGGHDGQVVPHP